VFSLFLSCVLRTVTRTMVFKYKRLSHKLERNLNFNTHAVKLSCLVWKTLNCISPWSIRLKICKILVIVSYLQEVLKLNIRGWCISPLLCESFISQTSQLVKLCGRLNDVGNMHHNLSRVLFWSLAVQYKQNVQSTACAVDRVCWWYNFCPCSVESGLLISFDFNRVFFFCCDLQWMNVWINEGYKIANNAFGSSAYSTIKDHFPTSFVVSWNGCRCYMVVEIFVLSTLGNKHRRVGYCLIVSLKNSREFTTKTIKYCGWPEGEGGQSLLPCHMRCRSAAGWLLGSRYWIPFRACIFVCCVCCVLYT